MVATYLGYTDYDQWDIVKEVKGISSDSYPNKPGGASDYAKGMEYATDSDYTATRSNGVISVSSMYTYMTDSMPIIIAIGSYNKGKRVSGHAVVVYSVDKSNNKFKVKNPVSDYVTTYNHSTITSSSSSSRYDAPIIIS